MEERPRIRAINGKIAGSLCSDALREVVGKYEINVNCRSLPRLGKSLVR